MATDLLLPLASHVEAVKVQRMEATATMIGIAS